jgi:acylphosphatase
MPHERVRRHVIVTGRVQGVWFRASTRTEAQARGVAGWICNRYDGAVEAVLEGPEAAVNEVVEYCRRGPRGARVENVSVQPEPPEGLQGFEIR